MKLRNHISGMVRDESGAVLVFWAMGLAVFLGMIALSFDTGRVGTTQSDLQSYADQVALAAAGELDGRADSITRASDAAAQMISDFQTFSDDDRTLAGAGDYQLLFYTTLPNLDVTRLDTLTPTTDGRRARYVRVIVRQHRVLTPFANGLRLLIGEARVDPLVSAEAVGGMTSYACDITPLLFCAPSGFTAEGYVGRMINLRSGGGGSQWLPGNFGFVDLSQLPPDEDGACAGLNGAQLYRCLVGADKGITGCIKTETGVNTEPGQRVGLAEAFNTRFDMFLPPMQSKRNDPDYAPAPNVVKGIKASNGSACINNNSVDPTDAIALPRDRCFATNTCGLDPSGRFGDGDWDRAAYVAANHGGGDPDPGAPSPNVAVTTAEKLAASRYTLYLKEIADAGGANGPNPILPGMAETGRPTCAPAASSDLNRRVLIAAAIDCSGGVGGGSTNVPVVEFVKIFMTEPVGAVAGDPSSVDIWGEVIGSAGRVGAANVGGIYQDFVQLYR